MVLPTSLPRTGIWVNGLDLQAPAVATGLVAELEELGLGAIWLSEGLAHDPFVTAAGLLAATHRLLVGTGIAVTYGRHPHWMRASARAVPGFLSGSVRIRDRHIQSPSRRRSARTRISQTAGHLARLPRRSRHTGHPACPARTARLRSVTSHPGGARSARPAAGSGQGRRRYHLSCDARTHRAGPRHPRTGPDARGRTGRRGRGRRRGTPGHALTHMWAPTCPTPVTARAGSDSASPTPISPHPAATGSSTRWSRSGKTKCDNGSPPISPPARITSAFRRYQPSRSPSRHSNGNCWPLSMTAFADRCVSRAVQGSPAAAGFPDLLTNA